MGIVIDRRSFRQQRTKCAQALFVFENVKNLPADVGVCNLGLELSSRIVGISKENIPPLSSELEKMLSMMSSDVVLDRIDFLFDPVWKVDVLKLLLSVGRNRRLYIVWPGVMHDNTLTYSVRGRPDWQTYEISVYNDLYVIRK